MSIRRRSRWSRPGIAAALTGTLVAGLAPAAHASPDHETIWESGVVTGVSDGDTLTAQLTAGSGKRGKQRVRTIGVQAPEVSHGGSKADCGGAQGTAKLRGQLPAGARVQTRSVDVASNDDYSGGRIVRSLYARDAEGNWYDTSRRTVSQGWLMWFPLAADSGNKPEWAHNLEYCVLADDAAADRRGLWSASLCGTRRYPGLDVRIWAKYWGTEQVWIENNGPTTIDLSGWIVRDAGINAYRTLPRGTVIASGRTRLVFTGDLNLNNLPSDNDAFEGDAVYLMEPATSRLRTGNLRAWFPYPCNPDACTDRLAGRVSVRATQVSDPPQERPSAPGSVRAVASTDGTGRVTVSWAAPTNLGAPAVTYTIIARATDGGAQPAAVTGVTGLTQTIGGLTLGRAYDFTVRASTSVGSSASTPATPPVAPIGLPGAPGAPVVQPRGSTAVVSWQPPAGAPTEPPVGYQVTTMRGGVAGPTCATADGATSCQLAGLTAGASYTATVRAQVGSQARSSAATTFTATPPAVGNGATPAAPTGVVLRAGDGRAVVSWVPADGQAPSGPVVGYDVAVVGPDGTREAGCTTTGAASCAVDGLTNGTPYVAEVTARTATSTGAPSQPSASATPTAHVTTRSGGPTAAPPAAEPWVGGEIVELTNTTGQPVRLGGYGLWDLYSATSGSSDSARYLFPPEQAIAANGTLLVHFGSAPPTKPTAQAGRPWLWTGTDTFINSTGDFVELAHLNRAQVDCTTTPGGTCRAARQESVASAPLGITAQASATRVTVTWGAPISRGGTRITGYTATAYSKPVGGSVLATCSTAGALSCSFPGRIGRTYYAEVVARNAQGTSGPSWRVLAAPRTVPGAPARVTVSSTPGGLNVRWSPAAPNGAAVTSYTAAAYTAGTGGSAVATCATSSAAVTGCTIPGLRGGTRYHVEVRATNRAGRGRVSSPRMIGAPGAGRAVSTYAARRVTVRWDAPVTRNGLVGYTARLYTKASGGRLVGSCVAAPSAAGCTTGKLPKRRTYHIELTTRTTKGSYVTRPRIVTGPPRKPSAPRVAAVSVTPAKRAAVRWIRPTSTGYAYLGGYQVALYSKARKGSVRARCATGPAATVCAAGPLPRGTYYAAVRARNAKGWSPWSTRMKVVVR